MSIGMGEALLILLILLLLFGGKKLPELAEGLGKALKNFRKAAMEDEPEEKKAIKDEEKEKAE